MEILKKALESTLTAADIAGLLSLKKKEDLQELYEAAYKVKLQYVGNEVRLRGLVEISNICTKDCFYCGIRKSNTLVHRFAMSMEEICDTAMLALEFGYGSVVLQGGERCDAAHAGFIEETVRRIKQLSGGRLGITLSLGEQTPEIYRRWREAGAHRYLLRIESSSPALYRRMHPASHLYESRVKALRDLREAGYQVGTGVMSCLPGQTAEDLAADICFFRDMDVDMIGMGPYLPHPDTPMGAGAPFVPPEERLETGLKMIAVTRLVLKDVNIASTTALQALAPDGRERGLLAGANVIMPNISAVKHRKDYLLYQGKPGTDENAAESREQLEKSILAIGEKISFNQWGDSPHALRHV